MTLKTLSGLLVLGTLVNVYCASPVSAELEPRYNSNATSTKYVNAFWYTEVDGVPTFVRGERTTQKGVFVNAETDFEQTIDLQGLYVIPPFGEAHNHSVDGSGTEKTAEKYLEEGVFYYKNPNSIYSFTKPLLPHWGRANTLDVSFSYGGISRDEGHPEKLYRMLSGWGMYPDVDVDSLDRNAFFDATTLDKLNERWPEVLSNKPDFLKLYLSEYGTENSAGLSEDVFREIVKRAKALSLPTTVHVETVPDLALAVAAGADEAAHLPAYDKKYADDESLSLIPDSLIKQMADTGFVVVATTNVSTNREYSEQEYAKVSSRQISNLSRMKEAGVRVTIGSDSYFQTSIKEINTLRALDIYTDIELLQMWINTPSISIFPNRAIGKLDAGYEASFLVLECNPIENFDCTTKISKRIKQGSNLGRPSK